MRTLSELSVAGSKLLQVTL